MATRIVVLAQDLIWADRLARAVTAGGAEPVRAASEAAALALLPDADGLIVDLTADGYDGIHALETARAAGVRLLAVGQHDDHALRKRALAAGAERVYAYRKLFADGPATIAGWLADGVRTGS
jgi:DNA-binding response OmpR family regulator